MSLARGSSVENILSSPMLRNEKILGVAIRINCQNKGEVNITKVKQVKEL